MAAAIKPDISGGEGGWRSAMGRWGRSSGAERRLGHSKEAFAALPVGPLGSKARSRLELGMWAPRP